jgi:hypothetical protein
VREAIARLRSLPRSEEQAQQLAEFKQTRHLIDLLELDSAAQLKDVTASVGAQEMDDLCNEIRIHCHFSSGQLWNHLEVADNLRHLPQGVAAVEAGQVGYSHLVHLARTAEKVGSALVESELLEFAKENSPGKLWYRCRYEVHRFDRERELADHNAEDERRFLSLRRQEDGSVLIEGRLDKVGGTAVEVCLRGLARRISADDDRTPEQRLADALAEVSMLAMDSGVVPNRGGTRTSLVVTTSAETLLGLAGAPAADLDGEPINWKTLERLTCDCSFTRLLMGPNSEPLDVGRAQRTFTGPRRRALDARDKGCTYPGCTRTARWCSGHHIVPWFRGGGSNVADSLLVCWHHHKKIHEWGYRLLRQDDGKVIVVPPMAAIYSGVSPPLVGGVPGAAGGGGRLSLMPWTSPVPASINLNETRQGAVPGR